MARSILMGVVVHWWILERIFIRPRVFVTV